jgi:4-hydroxybenzoate polyprenyltransferase
MKRSSGKLHKAFTLTKAFMRLVRLNNLLIIAATQFLMRYFVLKPLFALYGLKLQLGLPEFIMLVLSIVFISAAGYVINDYFDRKTDMINKPGRVLIGRYINRRFAMFIHLVFNVIAVSLGAFVCMSIGIPELTLVFLVVIGILWFYSTTYKRQLLVGNFIVSFFAGLVPLIVLLFEVPMLRNNYGGLLALVNTNISLFVAWIGGFSIFAFLTNLIREILKDLNDYEGDIAYGRNTVPIIWGRKVTQIILVALHAIMILLILMVVVFLLKDIPSFIYALIGLVVPLTVNAYLIYEAKSKESLKIASSILKLVMVVGIAFAIFANYLVI